MRSGFLRRLHGRFEDESLRFDTRELDAFTLTPVRHEAILVGVSATTGSEALGASVSDAAQVGFSNGHTVRILNYLPCEVG